MTAALALLDAVRRICASDPELSRFAIIPGALEATDLLPEHIPAVRLFSEDAEPPSPETAAVLTAARAFAPHAHWLRYYTEEQVGADFLARYGYFELAGPEGHFFWPDRRAFIAYWGPGLNYAWHSHAAEEIYHVLSGEAEFHVERQPARVLGPGGSSFHASHQPHALITRERPVSALILWRGEVGATELNLGEAVA